MADLVRDAHQEFWRPPIAQSAVSEMAEICRRCETEFMVGAAFCHICGANRHRAATAAATHWLRNFDFLHAIEWNKVKSWFGLPLPSLCAFLGGVACLIVALAVGFTEAKDGGDIQAIQLWRMQWLIAACAVFLVGILFKNSKSAS